MVVRQGVLYSPSMRDSSALEEVPQAWIGIIFCCIYRGYPCIVAMISIYIYMYIYMYIYIYIVDQNQCCEKSLSPFAVAVLHQTHSVQHDAFQEQLLISADEEAFLRRERCTEEFNQLEGQDRESNAPNHGLNHTKKPPRRNHHQGPLEDTYKKTYRNFQGIVERHI